MQHIPRQKPAVQSSSETMDTTSVSPSTPSHECTPSPLALTPLRHTAELERPENQALPDDIDGTGFLEALARAATLLSIPAFIPAIDPSTPRQTFAPSHSRVQTRQDHIDLLATTWMNSKDLAALVETDGLTFKKGKFSTDEQRLVKEAIQRYQERKGITCLELNHMMFEKYNKDRDEKFWSEIAFAVPGRSLLAVYQYVRRAYDPWRKQGRWMPSEDSLLLRAVAKHGMKWQLVSGDVGRPDGDCRDRYINHLKHRHIRVSGPWKKTEEDELMRVVDEIKLESGNRDLKPSDIPWSQVSERMGQTRSRQQCTAKWMSLTQHKENNRKTKNSVGENKFSDMGRRY